MAGKSIHRCILSLLFHILPYCPQCPAYKNVDGGGHQEPQRQHYKPTHSLFFFFSIGAVRITAVGRSPLGDSNGEVVAKSGRGGGLS